MYEKLTGRLSAVQSLSGKLSETQKINGVLYLPQLIINEGEGSNDYNELFNKPAINEHTLHSGNNTFEEIGIENPDSFTILDVIDAWNSN